MAPGRRAEGRQGQCHEKWRAEGGGGRAEGGGLTDDEGLWRTERSFYFVLVPPSVKRDNKSLLTKKYLKLVQISLVCSMIPIKIKLRKIPKLT